MDDADISEERYEKEIVGLIYKSSHGFQLEPTGQCHWCSESVAPGHKFCDADCRDAWDKDFKQRRASGKK